MVRCRRALYPMGYYLVVYKVLPRKALCYRSFALGQKSCGATCLRACTDQISSQRTTRTCIALPCLVLQLVTFSSPKQVTTPGSGPGHRVAPYVGTSPFTVNPCSPTLKLWTETWMEDSSKPFNHRKYTTQTRPWTRTYEGVGPELFWRGLGSQIPMVLRDQSGCLERLRDQSGCLERLGIENTS